MQPDPRALCSNCRDRQAKKGRAICSNCYRDGVRQRATSERAESGLMLRTRPEALVDTGLRIDDDMAELVHPDGSRQWPVPDHLIFTCWVEADAKNPRLLRVLRVAPAKERTRA